MTERPILMSSPMVRAILEGRKTQTRRVVKPQPTDVGGEWRYDKRDSVGQRTYWWPHGQVANDKFVRECCPYGVPGDRLWVRETWKPHPPGAGRTRPSAAIYRADYELSAGPGPWKPSIFMPRRACRLVLELTAVRVERLQEISEADAEAEGITLKPGISRSDPRAYKVFGAAYRVLWDSINAKRGFGWGVNPWLWVLEFKRA